MVYVNTAFSWDSLMHVENSDKIICGRFRVLDVGKDRIQIELKSKGRREWVCREHCWHDNDIGKKIVRNQMVKQYNSLKSKLAYVGKQLREEYPW